MIPEQAVEAAHEQLEAMGAYVSRDYVEAALEAAAPHMLAPICALMDDPEHYDSLGPSNGYVSVDNLREMLGEVKSNARAAIEEASPCIAREALANELVELAELIEPYSGIGLANGATRSEVAQWIRERAARYRTTDAR